VAHQSRNLARRQLAAKTQPDTQRNRSSPQTTSVPSVALASNLALQITSNREKSTPKNWHISLPSLRIPKFLQAEPLAAAALLLPVAMFAFVFAVSPNSYPPAGQNPPTLAFNRKSPVWESEVATRFALSLPPLRMPQQAPEISTPGEIQFAALSLPTVAPEIPSVMFPPTPIAIPPMGIASAFTLPRDLQPPDPGSISFAALELPSIAPDIAPLTPERSTSIVTTTPATTDVCMAAPGFTLTANSVAAMPAFLPSSDPAVFGQRLAEAARRQIGAVIYNARYTAIAYPMGDVSPFYGVCTDVVIRAYRSIGIDLQEIISIAKVGTGDRSIDHRRTEVMRKFFALAGETLPITDYAEDYLPGDIVTYYRPQNKSSTAHIAVVSDVVSASGRPMIIHNRGWGVQLEDALFVDKMTGHYRYSGPRTPMALASAKPVSKSATLPRLAVKLDTTAKATPTDRATLPAMTAVAPTLPAMRSIP
jgi:uncharacterized protein YijF (DUF1287 family)